MLPSCHWFAFKARFSTFLLRGLPAALALVVALASSAQAQDATRELRVATRILPPLVTDQSGTLGGFSIDIWNKIAELMKVKTQFEVTPNVAALLDSIRSGKADAGIAAISITAAREREFDFSQPMINAGLQIMVRGGHEQDTNPLSDLANQLFSRVSLVWLGIALLLVLVPAHLVWFLERNRADGVNAGRDYFPGIFHALFWAIGALATQAEAMPRQWLARIVAVLWMFASVVFIALYTAELTATLTVQQMQGSINGPDDLRGKKVATTRGSTAAVFLQGIKARVQEYSGIDEVYQALLNKDVDAVVFDAPVLMHYAANEGKGHVQMVGSLFRRQDYGIVFQNGSPLRKQVNNAMLQLREDGTYQQIYDKWFGMK